MRFVLTDRRAGPYRSLTARTRPCSGYAFSVATRRPFVTVNGIYTFRANAMPLDLSRQEAVPDTGIRRNVRSQVQTNNPPATPSDVFSTICIAVASIAFAPLLHVASPILAIAVESLVGVAIILAVPACAPAIAIFVLFFQNLFVSMLSSFVSSPSELDFVKGYNFLVCSVMWLGALTFYGLNRGTWPAEVNRIMRWSILTLAIVGMYFAAGLIQNGQAASIYLRNIVLPLFLFQLSLLTAVGREIRVAPFL